MAANAEGWAENTTEEDDWDLFWIDTSVSPERVMKMKWYQVNLFFFVKNPQKFHISNF